ncbi:hypothetical protein BH11PLA1_BH11PLA1_06570 [soil metagenome]
MEEKRPKSEPARLKVEGDWEQAAARLLRTPAKSTPPRVVKPKPKKPK